jgi:glycosyltransferase involved in cell wall biosynthesis
VANVLIIAYTTYIHDGRVKRQAEALTSRGDRVDVICLASEEPASRNGVNLIVVPMPRYRGSSRSGYALSYLRFFARASLIAFRLGRRKPYDVAIVCTMPDAAVLCAIPSKLMGTKIVLDVHDTMPELYQEKFGDRKGRLGARLLMFEERSSAWLADRVLAVHDLHRRRLEEAGVPAEKIEVVMNAPDPQIFKAQNHCASNGDLTLVCHGTVTQRLGVDISLHAMCLLLPRLPRVRLRIIGTGDFMAEAQRLVQTFNLGENVSFDAPVPIDSLPMALEGATLGLVPNHVSRATHLMLPVKLLEYAALGIPVVAARLRTIEHYFRDDEVCFFEPGDAVDLANQIERLCLHPEERAGQTERARSAVERLSWTNQRERYYQAIDSLIASSRAVVSISKSVS